MGAPVSCAVAATSRFCTPGRREIPGTPRQSRLRCGGVRAVVLFCIRCRRAISCLIKAIGGRNSEKNSAASDDLKVFGTTFGRDCSAVPRSASSGTCAKSYPPGDFSMQDLAEAKCSCERAVFMNVLASTHHQRL